MSDRTIAYASASPALRKPPPTRHSRYAMAAIGAYAIVALGKLCVWIYGCFRWGPYWRAYRLSAFVVVPNGLALFALWLYIVGCALAVIAIAKSDRKKTLAIFALVLNAFGAYAVYVTNIDDNYGFLYGLLFGWLPKACG